VQAVETLVDRVEGQTFAPRIAPLKSACMVELDAVPSNTSAEPRHLSMPVLSPGGFSRLAWVEWGPENAARTVVCVHGLTRNARDFDFLALELAAKGWRVVSVDVPGRGRSEWLRRPEDYGLPVYAGVLAALIGRLGVDTVDWVGTSMGGMIGMALAAQPNTPIRRLVLNDVGAFIPKAPLERIAQYVGRDPRFDDIAGVEALLRKVHAPFGPLTDAQWSHLATHGAAKTEDGRWRLGYDPAIAKAFVATPIADVALWPLWEPVTGPVLILRGADSDLLLRETAQEMTRRGAAAMAGKVELREIAGVGHAPALMALDQIAPVREFLGREQG
jgi:pimeloyl-ACP methyl ester carboxylesterase